MSKENLEAYRRGLEAFNRADWTASAATMDPDVLLRADRNWPEQVVYGGDAVTAFLRGLHEAGMTRVEIEEMVDLGDRVLARLRLVVRGTTSGAEAAQHYSNIVTYRNGLVVLNEFFVRHDDALGAVGLAQGPNRP